MNFCGGLSRSVWTPKPLRDSMLAISGELDSKRPYSSLAAIAGDGLVRNGTIISVASNSNSEPELTIEVIKQSASLTTFQQQDVQHGGVNDESDWRRRYSDRSTSQLSKRLPPHRSRQRCQIA